MRNLTARSIQVTRFMGVTAPPATGGGLLAPHRVADDGSRRSLANLVRIPRFISIYVVLLLVVATLVATATPELSRHPLRPEVAARSADYNFGQGYVMGAGDGRNPLTTERFQIRPTAMNLGKTRWSGLLSTQRLRVIGLLGRTARSSTSWTPLMTAG